MANTSALTPANIISTARTAATQAAGSTAQPGDSGTITTWALPGKTAQKLFDGTQSYSTKKGEIFTDFASGPSGTGDSIFTPTLSTQEGTPKQND